MSILKRRDGADKQREDRDAIAAALVANRARADEVVRQTQPSQPALSSEESEALSKARYAVAQEARRQKAEAIKALADIRSQVQDIANTAELARDIALAARDLEAAVTAQIRINGAHPLAEHIDAQGQHRFDSSWRSSR
jgi:hypothetical protein